MSTLEKAANIIYDAAYDKDGDMLAKAQEILSLIASEPSELEAVKECEHKDGDAGKILMKGGVILSTDARCKICKGSGFTRCILTKEEALKIFYAMADGDAERELYYSQDGGKIFMMWNGERIERRK